MNQTFSLRAVGNGEFRLQPMIAANVRGSPSLHLVVGSNNIKLCEILINYPMNFDVNYLAALARSLAALALSCSRRVEQVKNTSWFLAFQSGPPRRGEERRERRTELDRLRRRCTNLWTPKSLFLH